MLLLLALVRTKKERLYFVSKLHPVCLFVNQLCNRSQLSLRHKELRLAPATGTGTEHILGRQTSGMQAALFGEPVVLQLTVSVSLLMPLLCMEISIFQSTNFFFCGNFFQGTRLMYCNVSGSPCGATVWVYGVVQLNMERCLFN